jgi:hypothetical protein
MSMHKWSSHQLYTPGCSAELPSRRVAPRKPVMQIVPLIEQEMECHLHPYQSRFPLYLPIEEPLFPLFECSADRLVRDDS